MKERKIDRKKDRWKDGKSCRVVSAYVLNTHYLENKYDYMLGLFSLSLSFITLHQLVMHPLFTGLYP